jgi:hypothetical protein
VHHGGAWTAVAVVEINQRAIQRERVLDVAPIALVRGHVLRRAVAERARRLRDELDAVGTKGERAGARGTGDPKK